MITEQYNKMFWRDSKPGIFGEGSEPIQPQQLSPSGLAAP